MITQRNNQAPLLLYAYPSDESQYITLDTTFNFHFNKPVKAGSGYVTLNNNQGDIRQIAINDAQQVQFNGKNGDVLINPTQNLLANSQYFVQIDPGAITDAAGNGFSGITDTTTLNFSTGSIISLDTTPPSLQSSYPASASTDIPTGSVISLWFNEPIKMGTEGYITLSNGQGDTRQIPITDTAQIRFSSSKWGGYPLGSLEIDPSQDLLAGSQYFIQVSPGAITDVAGNPFAGITDTTTLSFKTIPPDTTPPMFLASYPSSASINIPTTLDNLTLWLNEPIKMGTGYITLNNNQGDIRRIAVNDAEQVKFDGMNGVIINPKEDLLANTQYTIVLEEGVVTDQVGNPFTNTLSFKTSLTPAPSDTTAPTLLNSYPANENAVIPTTIDNITLWFNETIKRGTGYITLSDGLTDTRRIEINDTEQLRFDGANGVIINPKEELLPNTSYTIQVDPGAVTDTAGNSFVGTTDADTYRFKTGSLNPIPLSSTPADDLTNVPVTTKITVSFNKPIQIGAGYITLSNGSDDTRHIDIQDVSQINIAGDTLTIKPAQLLHPDTAYTVGWDAGIITDLANHPITGSTNGDTFPFNFRTMPIGDTTAPTIAYSYPYNNAEFISPNNNIDFYFNEPITSGSGSLTLTNSAGDTRVIDIQDSSQVSILDYSLSINPKADLLPESNYTLQWSAGLVTDWAGNDIMASNAQSQINFRTTSPPADIAGPTLISSYPANTNGNFATQNDIALWFNETIKLGTGYITLSNNQGDARHIAINDPEQVRFDGANGIIINPKENLLANTQYTLLLDDGIVTDRSGNPFTNTLNFKTTAPDTTAPTFLDSYPVNTSKNVLTEIDNITLWFNETIKMGTGYITLSDGLADTRRIAINDTEQVRFDGANGIIINPKEDLLPSTAYTIQLDPSAITDTAGNTFAGMISPDGYTFKTAPLEPVALSSVPADDLNNVPLNTEISGTFNKPIKLGSGYVTLSNGADDIRHIDIQDARQVSISGNTLTLKPTQKLQPDSEYTVEWDTGVITDLVGRPLAGSAVDDKLPFNFKTVSSAPVALYSSPADDITNVSLDANISSTFDKPIQRGAGYITISNGINDTRHIDIQDARQVSIIGNTLTINPTQNLQPDSDYTVEWDTGIITDLAGHAVAGSATDDKPPYNFRTMPPDNVPPTIAYSYPANNEVNVGLDGYMNITFSEPVKTGFGSLTLSNGGGDTRQIAIHDNSQVYLGGGKASDTYTTLIINPNEDLLANSHYTLQWPTGLVTDLAGNTVIASNDQSLLSFSTIAPPPVDTTAPTVQSSYPNTNSGYALVESNISIYFDELIKINSGYITLSNNQGDTRRIAVNDPEQVILNAGKDTAAHSYSLTINPKEDLLANSQYSIQLDSGIVTDLAGNAFSGIVAANAFNTAPLQPVVTSSMPYDTNGAVPLNAIIGANFNKPIKIGSGYVTISNGTGDTRRIDIQDTSQVSVLYDTSLHIKPTHNLQPGSLYTVTWDAGIITDLTGHGIGGSDASVPFNFKTAPPDSTAPTLSYSYPSDDMVGATIDSNINLEFNEPVKAGTGYITISNGMGDVRQIKIDDAAQITFNGKQGLTINPSENLLADSAYFVQLDRGVITDISGNAFAGITDTTTLNFKTAPPDITAPFPNPIYSPMSTNSDIYLYFNEPIVVNSGYITLSNGSSDTRRIAITDTSQVNFSGKGGALTINPNEDLLAGSHYTVQIDHGVVSDLAGNKTLEALLQFETAIKIAPAASNPVVETNHGGIAGVYDKGDILTFNLDTPIKSYQGFSLQSHGFGGGDLILSPNGLSVSVELTANSTVAPGDILSLVGVTDIAGRMSYSNVDFTL